MKRGFDDKDLFPHVANYAGLIRLKEVKTDTSTEPPNDNGDNAILDKQYEMVSSLPVSDELSKLHPTDVYSAHLRGKYISIYKSKQGLLTYGFIEEDTPETLGKSLRQIDKTLGKSLRQIDKTQGKSLVVLDPGEITILKPIDGTRLEGTSPEGVRINIEGNVRSAITLEEGKDPDGEDYDQPHKVVITHQSVIDGQAQPKQTFDAELVPGNIENTGFKLELPDAILKTSDSHITATAHFSTVADLTDRILVPVIIGPPPDTTPPDVKISPMDTDIPTTTDETPLHIEGTASDPESGIQLVEVDIGDGFNAAQPSVNDWSKWSYQGTTSRTGDLQITAKAINKAGLSKDDSKSITITRVVSKPPRLRLYLAEGYRLSSYLGQYGAGRVIKTFSLLPGEKTKISVRTFTKTVTQTKQSSSILDSVTDESTKDFENTLEQEQSDKEQFKETFSYEVNGKAEASWGWGKASVSGGVKGGTDAARETFAKNVMNTTQKHATKASAKRDVTVNSSYERIDETQTEDQIEREIQNINVGRTLNFVFRQMNQEIITILHLTDARVVVWDGISDPSTSIRKEYTIPELDRLLEEFIVKDHHDMVKKGILDMLRGILPAVPINEGEEIKRVDFIEEIEPDGKEWRVKRITSEYTIPETGTPLRVPGIIMSLETNVMRTEGILVEALLGRSNALDRYSKRLQDASARLRELENEIKDVQREKDQLAISIVRTSNEEKAEVFEKVFPCCQPTIFSLWPPKPKDTVNQKNQSQNDDNR
jgi:hypothetical protein